MRMIIFIPAYEAEQTLEQVVRRIPGEVYSDVEEILIQDDASRDNTYNVAIGLTHEWPKITVVKNDVNLGYGGTKKKAYKYCINEGYDAVVMVHGDGQLPPECLPDMLAPLVDDRADVVLGSRMSGDPLGSGMPLYKWLGNLFLTTLANLFLGKQLTDYHTGYRAYRCTTLAALDLNSCSNGHEISMELLIRAVNKDFRITEAAVPTYYGSGSRSCSFTTSIKYGLNVVRMVILNRLGYRTS